MKKTLLTINEIKEMHHAGKLDAAKEAYLEFLTHYPEDTTALHLLAILYAELGQLEDAQSYLEKAILSNADDPGLRLHLANVLKAHGQYHQAVQILLELIERHPKFVAAFNNLGTIYYAEGKLEQAVRAYKQAIDLQSDYVDAYYNLGLALSKLNRLEQAISTYQSVLDLSPAHPGAQFQLACLFMQGGRYKEALDLFRAIEKAHPFHFETQTNLATCYLKLGQLDEAEIHYLKGLELMPRDVQILFNLGVIQMQQGRIRESLDYYLRAVESDPKLYDAHNNLAFAYLLMRENEKALQHFRAALQLQPNNKAIQHTIHILTQDKSIATSPPEYVRSLFDSYADHFDAHLTQTLNYQVPQRLYTLLQEVVELSNQQWDILDIGCGTGLSGVLFKSIAHSLVGVDLSGKMLAIAEQKKVYDQLFESDIVAFLTRQQAKFNLIIAGDVIVYFGDLATLFPLIAQALKPKGYFVFNTEINEKENYQILPSGRFAHRKAYIDQLAQENGLVILNYAAAPLRTQDKKLVYGHVYVMQKMTPTPS